MIPDIKKNIKVSFATVAAALAMTGCTSYEIDMPANPAEPIVGNEVSTNVIYQANPRFFGEHECLKALTAQLPRISEMGCDIVWIMPVFTPGEENSIGSPYCIRDFKSVNPRYGTMADLKELVNSAHSKGMKVMLDWVANHTSWDHPWITEHPDRYDKDSEGHIVSPEGWPDVAQLDFNNSATCAAMAEAMSFWVEQAGIDGFRCDYVEGVPQEFWSKTIADLHASHPELIMLAETGNAAYYADGFD
ncbi:MAG: alpha-amylase, partial [Muribaculaceae bacterium]|nr:alpha-amylase [Muribaculaceae bacterium]